MSAPESPSSENPSAPISKAAWWAMAIVLGGMLLVAVHMNYVRWQRDHIEKVTVTPVAPPTPSASPSVSP